MTDDSLGKAFTLREWDEAWAQSRHLETMRGQYVGFFFTALLAVIAFSANQTADDSLRSSGSLLTVSALAYGLQLLSAFLYLAVVRINKVLFHYSQIIYSIRDQVDHGHSPPLDLGLHRRPPTTTRGELKYRLKTTQGVSELVLLFGVVGLPVLLATTVLRAATVGHMPTTALGLCALAFGASLGTCGLCGWALREPSAPSSGCAPQP